MKTSLVSSISLGIILIASQAVAADVREVDLDTGSLEKRTVTVYSSGYAHVQDDHSVVLQKGQVELNIEDIPQDVDAGSVAVKAEGVGLDSMTLSQPPRSVHDYLQMAVGQEVRAVRINPRNGRDVEEKAVLVSVDPSIILMIDGRLEINYPGRIVLPEAMADLDGNNAEIEVKAVVAKTAKRDVAVQYKLPGLQWLANYQATYNADKNLLNMQGRIGVTNHSQADFEDVSLRVVSGQPAQVSQPRIMMRAAKMDMAEAAVDMPPQIVTSVQSVGYHLYTLPGQVSIDAGTHKEFVFFEQNNIPVQPVYVVKNPVYASASSRSDWNRHDAVLRLGVAKTENGAGEDRPALPFGTVRVVTPQTDGVDMLTGEVRIPHVPAGDAFELNLGQSVDVTAKSRQVHYERISKTTSEHDFEIVLHNASENSVNMEVTQNFSGQWKVLDESLPHSQFSSHTAKWLAEIPAKGEKTLTFKVQITR